MKNKENVAWAVAAYFIFFLPLLTDAKKDSFVRYHVRQGLGLLITFFALRFATIFLFGPGFFLIGLVYGFVVMAANLFLLALLIVGIVNASKGEKKPLPVVGTLAEKYLKI